jgi:hypothetical protein
MRVPHMASTDLMTIFKSEKYEKDRRKMYNTSLISINIWHAYTVYDESFIEAMKCNVKVIEMP